MLYAFRDAALSYLALMLLALMCTAWSIFALPLYFLLPARWGARLGRDVMHWGFRAYIMLLRFLRVYRFEFDGLEALQDSSPLILAPNHPLLIDALVLVALRRNLVCVMKDSVDRNFLLSAGARFARFIRNDSPYSVVRGAVQALRAGSSLLLFPEGTRTTRSPVNDLQGTVAVISHSAQVPIQTLLIETDSDYLSKGSFILKTPALPIRYRIRLGRRFAPPADRHRFIEELREYFVLELSDAPQAAWLEGDAAHGRARSA